MKSKRTKATRKITMLLAMTMLSEQLVSTGAVLYAHAEDVTSAEYTIEHGVTSSWDGGCTAEIILTNKADVDTEKWSVSFCTCDEITNLWGGQITDCQEITESYYGEGRVEVFEENKEEVLSETDNYREETEVAPLEDEVDKETEASEDVASEEKINDTEEAETDFTDVLEEKAEEEAYAVLSEEALEVDIVEFDETEVFKEIEDEAKHYYSYTVECLDYNAAIPAGGSVRIGYSANGKEHDIWEKKATIEFKKDEVEEKTIPVGGIYVGEGYTVEVVVPAYWENAYNVQLKITNISEEIIHNWAFVMETADDIVNLYNAVELSNKEGVRLIKNVGYNQDIPVGGTIEVGYTASYEKNADVPSGFALSQIETEVTTDECEVSIFITDEWGNGGLAQIAIKNNSELPIEDWMIKFDSALDIKEIWGGVIESHEGEHYFIRNAEYAQNIAVGESWTVGILFSGDMLDIQNLEVRQIVADNNVTPIQEKVIDDSSIVELDTSNTGRDVGRVFYKEITCDEDIIISSENLLCVRDQILLTVTGKSYDEITDIVDSFDARIVGCIEMTGDYQIEFKHEKDIEELERFVSDLQNESYIELADLNYIWLEEPNFNTTDLWEEGMLVGISLDWEDAVNAADTNWGIEAINLSDGLLAAGLIKNLASTGKNVDFSKLNTTRVGIIDIAFDEGHEDLDIAKSFMSYPDHYDYERLCNELKYSPKMCHGTNVAGVIGATFDNGKGISGVSLKNELFVAALNENESYYTNAKGNFDDSLRCDAHVFKVKCALDALVISDVKVINYSYGHNGMAYAMTKGDVDDTTEHDIYITNRQYLYKQTNYIAQFLDNLIDRGYDFIIVASAGNANNLKFVPYSIFDNDPNKSLNAGYKADGEITPGSRSYEINAQYNSAFTNIPNTWKCYDHIMCVGAIELSSSGFDIAEYSNRGARVDVLAPGEAFTTTIRDQSILAERFRDLAKETKDASIKNNAELMAKSVEACSAIQSYDLGSGTSMAAPYVTGAIALAYSLNPTISAVDMKQAVIDSARNEGLGTNVLDVAGLVKKICPKTSAVSGEVICSDTGKAPEKTRISIFDANSSTTLVKEVDISEGIYNINLAPGEYCIYYATDGYITIVSDNVKVLNNSVYINDVVLSPTEKPITNGKLYWRYTPAGIGYDDNVVAYAQPNENYDYTRRRYMSRRGCGLSNVESATYDLILSELTEITWEQYLREKEEQDIFWGMVKLIDIPLYNISDGSQSNYYLRFSYMLHEGHYSSSSPWYYSIQTAIELYDGNRMLKNWSSVYLDPPFKLNDADRNQNYRYFVYAGSGKLWANSDATSELDNNIYMGEVLYCEDSQTSNIYIGNNYDVINYQWLMDTYGVKLDDSLYKGNNDNPNYPIK